MEDIEIIDVPNKQLKKKKTIKLKFYVYPIKSPADKQWIGHIKEGAWNRVEEGCVHWAEGDEIPAEKEGKMSPIHAIFSSAFNNDATSHGLKFKAYPKRRANWKSSQVQEIFFELRVPKVKQFAYSPYSGNVFDTDGGRSNLMKAMIYMMSGMGP